MIARLADKALIRPDKNPCKQISQAFRMKCVEGFMLFLQMPKSYSFAM